MAWVLDHPEDARIMAKRGRERMTEYGLPQIIKVYEALYAEALSA
jgi:hypothetical protein